VTYAALPDLIALAGRDEIISLTDRDGATGDVVEAVGAAALDAATAEISGWLAARYAVPLSPVPPQVKDWCATAARYRLWLSSPQGPPDFVRAAYEDAKGAMRAAADGRLTLTAAAPPTPAPSPGGGVLAHQPPRQIGPRGLADFLGGL
jgi:phage gp36-like protein